MTIAIGGANPLPQSDGAFGVDPTQKLRYKLRHSRYDALAHDVSEWAGAAAQASGSLSVLDVGCGWGPLLRHLDHRPNFDNIELSAADMTDMALYRKERYHQFFVGDLRQGYPEIPSDRYDVVVCEQVLEHLDALDTAIATLARVAKPGGIVVIGVPIFPPPLHLIRKHVVPRVAALVGHPETASHQQAFSLRSFRALLRMHPSLEFRQARGFRIISGGLLSPLENYRWWWSFNRRLGALIPAACIEVQVLLQKI